MKTYTMGTSFKGLLVASVMLGLVGGKSVTNGQLQGGKRPAAETETRKGV